jgi:hypothetical protein
VVVPHIRDALVQRAAPFHAAVRHAGARRWTAAARRARQQTRLVPAPGAAPLASCPHASASSCAPQTGRGHRVPQPLLLCLVQRLGVPRVCGLRLPQVGRQGQGGVGARLQQPATQGARRRRGRGGEGSGTGGCRSPGMCRGACLGCPAADRRPASPPPPPGGVLRQRPQAGGALERVHRHVPAQVRGRAAAAAAAAGIPNCRACSFILPAGGAAGAAGRRPGGSPTRPHPFALPPGTSTSA